MRALGGATRTMPTASPTGRRLHVEPGNGGGDGSAGNPFGGLQEAADNAISGDVFLVAPGTYDAFAIAESGTPGQPIVFLGPGDGSAIVDGPTPTAAWSPWAPTARRRFPTSPCRASPSRTASGASTRSTAARSRSWATTSATCPSACSTAEVRTSSGTRPCATTGSRGAPRGPASVSRKSAASTCAATAT